MIKPEPTTLSELLDAFVKAVREKPPIRPSGQPWFEKAPDGWVESVISDSESLLAARSAIEAAFSSLKEENERLHKIAKAGIDFCAAIQRNNGWTVSYMKLDERDAYINLSNSRASLEGRK